MSAPGFRLATVHFDADEMVDSVTVVVSSSTLRIVSEFGGEEFEPVSETEWKVELTRAQAISLIRFCGNQAPVDHGHEHTKAIWGSHLLRVVDFMEKDW